MRLIVVRETAPVSIMKAAVHLLMITSSRSGIWSHNRLKLVKSWSNLGDMSVVCCDVPVVPLPHKYLGYRTEAGSGRTKVSPVVRAMWHTTEDLT